MPYEWTHRRPLRRINGADVAPGETFEPTDAELTSFRASIEEYGEGEAAGADANAGETASESSSEDTPLSEKHWRTAVSEVEDGEYDGRLGELAGDESLTDSVRDAIEERQAELENA